MWCRWFERELTALADGQLPAWRGAWARRHLLSCRACAARQAETESAVAAQRRLLPRLMPSSDVPMEEMLRRVRLRLAAEPELEVRRQLRPRLVLASAAGIIAVVLAFRVLNPVWIAIGIESPPEQLTEKPELFRDYQLFEHLPAIENFDRVPSGDSPDEGGRPMRG